MASVAEIDAMRRALDLAATARFSPGPNPQVGCVILDAHGATLGEGAHHGVGTAHAEVAALTAVGSSAVGATAVVTLEPCAHTGRTGPCTDALVAAGVTRVVFAQSDPNPQAAGGAVALRSQGIDVESGVLAGEAELLNERWTSAVTSGRPFVTLKLASSLDGKIAARDGSSRWITGSTARRQVHELRAESDAVIVGTGTVIADDPELTDRRDSAHWQPLPVVIGLRDLPPDSKLAARGALHLQTHDLNAAMRDLFAREHRSVLVEGGPKLATAFVRAGIVDRLVWYVAPCLIGDGLSALDDLGGTTIDDASRWILMSTEIVGNDIRIELRPRDSRLQEDSESQGSLSVSNSALSQGGDR